MATWTAMNVLLFLAAASFAIANPEMQKPIVTQHSPQQSSAKLVLYPGSRIHPEDLQSLNEETRPCDDDGATAEIDLEVGACLSGDYYLHNNFKITELPSCGDGIKPVITYYPRRGCVEPFAVHRYLQETDMCLWQKEQQPNPSYYWSLVIRCSRPVYPEILRHQVAVPPAITHQTTGGVKGTVAYYAGKPCRHEHDFLGFASTLALDHCGGPWRQTVPYWAFTRLKITQPPICPNGTRAQLARFEHTPEDDADFGKPTCNGGKMTFRDGLVDINDDDINKCLPVVGMELIRHRRFEHFVDARGIKWHCDGLDPSSPAKKAETPDLIVSHSLCPGVGRYNGHQRVPDRPATFFAVPVDTCVDIRASQRIDKRGTHMVRVAKRAACPEGRVLSMASWRGFGCDGGPDRVESVYTGWSTDCTRFGDDGSDASYSFRCS